MTRSEESIAAPGETKIWEVVPSGSFALALHGGAGGRISELSAENREAFEVGLASAHAAGIRVLERDGSALDAVCASVEQLENDPLFNAGRGAALTANGTAELDAAVMIGSGQAGAIAVSRHVRNPIFLARSVMERSSHLLIVDPSEQLAIDWGQALAEPEYFLTEARQRQLERILATPMDAPRHGTVGAVARDSRGHVAAATSTGGMAGQDAGRVGDTPIIGAGTYARDGLAALSCTGDGEAFLRGVVSYDIVARMRYLGLGLGQAVVETIRTELTEKNASGGLVSVDADGVLVIAHNSPTMFAAFLHNEKLVLLT